MVFVIENKNKTNALNLAKNLIGTILTLIFLTITPELSAEDFFSSDVSSQVNNEQNFNFSYLSFSYLNNEQLLERAQQLRSQHPNSPQLKFNNQWLRAHQNDDHIIGKKVYQTLFKRGFKKFWHRQRKERFKSERIPDINGRGSVSNEVDYKLRLKSDEIKVKLSYEF